MPVISFASPKGGSGKTTAALLLATEIAQKGVGVTVIDADPETYIDRWAKLPDKPKSLKVIKSPTEKTIIDDIHRAMKDSAFVVIDLEGTANMLVAYAISQSDLVIIPLQPSDLDARGAAKALELVKQQEKAFKREIPHAILFTRTKAAIRTRTLSHIQEELNKANVSVFQTQLLEREVYRALFSFGGTLESLDEKEVYKRGDAIINARAFAGEVIDFVKKSKPKQARQIEVA
ncbi:MAG: AAA family ATPase [Candidatus Omnitrophota bacterium]